MNAQLIMLPNPILCIGDDFHNNNLAEKDFAFHWRTKEILQVISKVTKTGCWLCNDNTHRDSYKLLKIIAGIEGLPTVNLSIVANQIGWVDVEKLVSLLNTPEELDQYSFDSGFIQGFKAAQSLNEKKFSEEDLYKLLKLIGSKGYYVETDGSVYANAFNGGRIVNVVKEYTESLSKQEVYNVSIIQENNSITVTKILK